MATDKIKKIKPKKTFEDKASRYVDELFGISHSPSIVDASGNPFDKYPDDFDATILIDQDNEFDLVKLVGKAIDPLTGVPRDIKLPEGDFKEAKNFFDYCSNFRGPEAKFPFSRQMWLMLSLFGEMCPRCTKKSRIKSILNIPVHLSGREMNEYVQLTEYGVCPKCGAHKSEMINNKELNEYVEMNLCIGQRAGKSTTTAAGAEYLTHKYLMYPRLAGVCRGISSATPLVATFVGFRFSDAAMLLWKPVSDAINDSPWFQEYHRMLEHYGELHGMEFYRKKDEFLRYAHKNIELAPQGPSKRGLRGRTRFLSCLTGDARIMTDSGLIAIGDDLLGRKIEINGKYKNIVNWWCSGKRAVNELTLENGLSIKQTPDHRVLTYVPETQKTRWVETKDLIVGKSYVICGLGVKDDSERLVKLPELEIPYTREDKYRVVAEFLNAKFESKEHYTIKEAIEATGTVESFWTNLHTRLKRSDALERKKGNEQQAVFSYWTKRKLAAEEIFKNPQGSRVAKSNKMLPQYMSNDLASILGYLIADGDLSRNLKFDTKSSTKMKDFVSKWKTVFGTDLKRNRKHMRSARNKANGRVYFGSPAVVAFLRSIGLQVGAQNGIPGVNSRTKIVPEYIFRSTREHVLHFLSAALSCDGFAGGFREKEDDSVAFKNTYYYSESPELLRGMQLLFWRLGYAANLSGKTIHLCKGDSVRFRSEYTGLSKREWMSESTHEERVLDLDNTKKNWKPYRIPGSNGMFTRNELNPSHLYNPMIGAWTLSLVSSNVRLPGEYPVYDITVDSNLHGFIANGVLDKNCIDELGWFPIATDDDDDRERANADGVYDALDRSLLTLREEFSYLYQRGHNRFLQAYAINVSSPSSQADKITRLVEENKDSDTNLALRLPTWEISPYLPRTSKRIQNAYRKDPVAAERDYGANPPLNAKTFIQQDDAERAFLGPNRATAITLTKRINDRMRQGGKIETSGPQTPCPASLMSIDAGLTNNSFAITILQLQELRVGEKDSIVINVPVCLEIQPRKGHMLHYPMIYKNIMKPLIRDFNVRYLHADRWNSIVVLDTAMEDFAEQKLVAEQYSVKYADFIQAKSYIEEGKMILPKLEMESDAIRRVSEYPEYFLGKPAAHLLFQMITVKDMGKTVIKGDGYTDDLFRALVLGVSRILDDKIKSEILKMTALITRPRITGAIGAGRSNPAGIISNPTKTFMVTMTGGARGVPNAMPTVKTKYVPVVRINRR